MTMHPATHSMGSLGVVPDHKENFGHRTKEDSSQGGSKRASQQSHGQGSVKKNRYAFVDVSNSTGATALQDEFAVFEEAANAHSRDSQPASTSNRGQYPSHGSQRASSHKYHASVPVLGVRQQQQRTQQAHRRQDWFDIDLANADNPLACSAYAIDIFAHLRETERTRRANPTYTTTCQPEMTPHMRSVLVDWLVEVAQEYHLCSDTLFLAVNYLDRFLSVQRVGREELQLVGIACMWLASKYEEIHAPTARDFCFITDNTYSEQQLLAMEVTVLEALRYELTVPTAKVFLRRFLQAAEADEQLHYLASYVCELSLMNDEHMLFLASEVAAASLYLASVLLGRQPWNPTLQHYSTYSADDLAACVDMLTAVHDSCSHPEPEYMAIRDKYANPRLLCVSSVLPLHPRSPGGEAPMVLA